MASMYDKVDDFEIEIKSLLDTRISDFGIVISHPGIKQINYFFIGTLEEAHINALGFIHGYNYHKIVRAGE